MKDKIVLVSNNKGKIKEIKDYTGFNILSKDEYETIVNKKIIIEEDGNSFKENAIKKVDIDDNNYIFIADDSGLEIDALDGFPGIKTARWSNKDDYNKNLEILDKMNNKTNRSCHFTVVIAVKYKGIIKTFTNTLDGNIASNIRGENGFGFDSIFEVNNKTLAELTDKEKYKISPRNKSLEELNNYFKKIL